MTYTQYLGTFSNFATSPNNVSLTIPVGNTSVLLIAVGFTSAVGAVTSITVNLPVGASGTFFKISNIMGASRGLELWMGYNLVGYPTRIEVTSTGGTPTVVYATVVAADSSCATAPAQVTATNSGTSTAADSGTLTPAVGDVLVAAICWASVSSSSARTSFGNTFCWNVERSGSSTMVALVFNDAKVAAASHHTWTIASAAWIGVIAALTMPAPAAPVGAFVYKGRDTNTDDAGDVA